MTRLALLIEYDGKRFHGSQYQVGVRTVQSELEGALAKFARREIRLHLSGRTDTGVHAAGQVAHVDWPDDIELDLWRLTWGLNGIIKADLAVVNVQVVDNEFHSRFSAVSREYVYRILNRPQRSALLKDTHYFVPRSLDLKAMQDGASRLSGRNDFTAFRSTNADKSSTVCTVTRAELLQLGDGKLEFWIAADHFVYNMVRIIVGTLTEIGLGKKTPDSVGNALDIGDRALSGPTAPPWGLTLSSVRYPRQYKLFENEIPSNRRLKEISREDL